MPRSTVPRDHLSVRPRASVDAAGFAFTDDGRLVFTDIGERSGTPRLIVLRPDLPPAPGASG